MSQDIPVVSVIIINYNSSSYTTQCALSIIEQTKAGSKFEIIIVDNNSQQEDFDQLASVREIPFVKIFRSRINLGFSGGNMMGVQHASASSYYFFLNNDCVFLNDVIATLIEFLDQNQSAGVITGQMYSANMERQPSFGYYPSVPAILFGHGLMRIFCKDLYRSNKAEYHQPVIIPYTTGSAMFVRANYFASLGGFDTNYFLFCEEEDICMTMRRKGWGVYLVPAAKFIHYGGGSTNRNLDIDKEFYISYLYFIRKHYGCINRLVLKILYTTKLFRKLYKGRKFLKLSWFVLKGAPMKYSLRFKQVINYSE
jgi:GT2 family glycosyltransferase